MCEALFAQMSEGYEFADAITKQNRTWKMLNPEQQAQLIEDAFLADYFTNKVWAGNAFMTRYVMTITSDLINGKGAT